MAYGLQTYAKGCFGKVYKVPYKGEWAALKKVPVALASGQELDRECRVYAQAQHHNIVRLLGNPWLEEGKWHIPLEFIFGESLEITIFEQQKSRIQLTQSVKATIITGMCEGLNFIHSKDIVHQDLKPDNIMIEHGSHRAVIIDMGLAKFYRNGFSSAENGGNNAYCAPEIFQGYDRDTRSDVWAMGKIIGELCTSFRLPIVDLNSLMMKGVLKDSPYRSVVPRMVKTNAEARATMAMVISEIRQFSGMNHGAIQVRNQGANQWASQSVEAKEATERQWDMQVDYRRRTVGDPRASPLMALGTFPSPISQLANQFFQCPTFSSFQENSTMLHKRFDIDAGQVEFNYELRRNGEVVKKEHQIFFK